jgi:hypothetical protein
VLAITIALAGGCLPGPLLPPDPKQQAEQERIHEALSNPRLQQALQRKLQNTLICVATRFASNQPDPSQPTFYAFFTSKPMIPPEQSTKIILEELTTALGQRPKHYKTFLVQGSGEPPSCQELMKMQPQPD